MNISRDTVVALSSNLIATIIRAWLNGCGKNKRIWQMARNTSTCGRF